jgi:hypothetical protein
MNKITVGKMILFPYFCSVIFLFFSGCKIFDFDNYGEPASYENKFSVRNSTSSDISVKLVTGIIPHAAARYDELTPIPDEVYKLANPVWSAEEGTYRTVKPKNHNYVYNYTPIGNLGRVPSEHSESWERRKKLRELLLDKLVSFTVTISRGDAIIYRIAGWDIPDADMEIYQVNDKLWGYYDTREENYFHDEKTGYIRHLPLLYSKLFTGDRVEAYSPGSLTYYIDVKPDTASLVKFDPSSSNVRDDDFWKKH